jgi:hypothetical protein
MRFAISGDFGAITVGTGVLSLPISISFTGLIPGTKFVRYRYPV